jgi:hypothetical protein
VATKTQTTETTIIELSLFGGFESSLFSVRGALATGLAGDSSNVVLLNWISSQLSGVKELTLKKETKAQTEKPNSIARYMVRDESKNAGTARVWKLFI